MIHHSDTQQQLGMQNGALIAVPIPEEYEPIGKEVQNYVNQAVQESERNGMSESGNDVTPWLLNRIAELSNGNSLTCNIALLRNTALVGKPVSIYQLSIKISCILQGGQIATSYQKLLNEEVCVLFSLSFSDGPRWQRVDSEVNSTVWPGNSFNCSTVLGKPLTVCQFS